MCINRILFCLIFVADFFNKFKVYLSFQVPSTSDIEAAKTLKMDDSESDETLDFSSLNKTDPFLMYSEEPDGPDSKALIPDNTDSS